MPNPFAHIELNTDDLKKAKKFYQSVFAWKLSDMPGMPYTMVDVGGGVGGGMQKKQMPETPNAWLPYVQVDDLKATMAKAIKAGAKPSLEYQEIAGMGAIGIFIDPAGAPLGLWQSATSAAEPTPEKPASKSAPAKSAPEKPASKSAPAKSASEKPAAKSAPEKPAAKSAPAKSAPAKSTPAKSAPAKGAPAKSAPAKGASAKSAPAKSAPAKNTAKKGSQDSGKSAPTPPPPPVKKSAPKKR